MAVSNHRQNKWIWLVGLKALHCISIDNNVGGFCTYKPCSCLSEEARLVSLSRTADGSVTPLCGELLKSLAIISVFSLPSHGTEQAGCNTGGLYVWDRRMLILNRVRSVFSVIPSPKKEEFGVPIFTKLNPNRQFLPICLFDTFKSLDNHIPLYLSKQVYS